MSVRQLARLQEAPLTAAWVNEPAGFTPWLAENLDRLSEVLDIPLSLIRVEAGLPTGDDRFSADIHALDERDDSTVLIENQITNSDHQHLGQILTYLAGLEAKTVIWIAPKFREAHLSAIKWLNDHTTEEFRFFAVRVRVVQIENSPFAPIFELEEKPNDWQRRQQVSARAAKTLSGIGEDRKKFWAQFDAKYPDSPVPLGGGGNSNKWGRYSEGLVLSTYLSKDRVGIYMTVRQGTALETLEQLLDPYITEFETQLQVQPGPNRNGHYFSNTLSANYREESEFERIFEWLRTQIENYDRCLTRHFEREEKNI